MMGRGQAHAGATTVAHPVLLIGPSHEKPENSASRLFTPDAGFSLERTSWDALKFESVRPCAASMIIAVPGAQPAAALRFFEWSRSHPVDVPMFAILSEPVDDETLRCAIEVVDDFALSPVRRQELYHRVSRLLPPEHNTVADVRHRLTDELGLSQL